MSRHASAIVNVYETQARAAKVARIVALVPVGTTAEANASAAETMKAWSVEDRNAFAKAAGCLTPPSQKTWDHVVEAIRARVTPANDCRIPF